MQINVLDKDFNKIAIIDDYKSLMWCKRYNQIGALDLQIVANEETISVLKKGNYISRDDDDSVYKIEIIEINTAEGKDNSLIIGGTEIKKIIHQRIAYETNMYDTTVENVIRGLIENNIINPVNSNRRIDNFYLGDFQNFTDLIKTQITYSNVGEKIESLCKTYGYGYKVTLEDDGKLYFKLYSGKNRTDDQNELPHVVFSNEQENVISSKYNLDSSEFKNVALIAGEGEGDTRVKTEIGTATGLDRHELFVDGKSLSTNNGEILDSEYIQLLQEQGKEELSQNVDVISFEAMVDTSLYEYKIDFDLGDIVTISNEFGISANARIIEIIETWDSEGYTFEPKFEYIEVAEFEIPEMDGAITTEASVMMLSENGVALLSENSTSSSGVKISELEKTTELYDGCCIPIVQNGETKRVEYSTIKDKLQATFEINEDGHLIAEYK